MSYCDLPNTKFHFFPLLHAQSAYRCLTFFAFYCRTLPQGRAGLSWKPSAPPYFLLHNKYVSHYPQIPPPLFRLHNSHAVAVCDVAGGRHCLAVGLSDLVMWCLWRAVRRIAADCWAVCRTGTAARSLEHAGRYRYSFLIIRACLYLSQFPTTLHPVPLN
jgi:hypothetical protein